jgi:hypothetical protein
MTIAHDGRSSLELDGGGYKWKVNAERLTVAMLERHKG